MPILAGAAGAAVGTGAGGIAGDGISAGRAVAVSGSKGIASLISGVASLTG
jgi:hypothetical protein